MESGRLDMNIKDRMQTLLAENIEKKYECVSTNVKYSTVGRIYEMHFSEIK